MDLALSEAESRFLDAVRTLIGSSGKEPQFVTVLIHLKAQNRMEQLDVMRALEDKGLLKRSHSGSIFLIE